QTAQLLAAAQTRQTQRDQIYRQMLGEEAAEEQARARTLAAEAAQTARARALAEEAARLAEQASQLPVQPQVAAPPAQPQPPPPPAAPPPLPPPAPIPAATGAQTAQEGLANLRALEEQRRQLAAQIEAQRVRIADQQRLDIGQNPLYQPLRTPALETELERLTTRLGQLDQQIQSTADALETLVNQLGVTEQQLGVVPATPARQIPEQIDPEALALERRSRADVNLLQQMVGRNVPGAVEALQQATRQPIETAPTVEVATARELAGQFQQVRQAAAAPPPE